MSRLLNVKGHSDLKMDAVSGAVINTNKTEIQNARTRKAVLAQKREKEQQLQKDVDTLKEDMSDLKQMMQTLLEKL